MDSDAVRREVVELLRITKRAPEQPSPGGATEAELSNVESRLGRPLPGPLADWLRLCKGEAIGPGGVYGARPDEPWHDIVAVLDRWPNWRARGWLPIAGDGCGDYYVLVTGDELAGCVGFIDQAEPDEIDYVVASDVWRFIRFLLRDEAGERDWPFDAAAVLDADPGMATVPAALRPWRPSKHG